MGSREETFEALVQKFSRLVASAIRRVCARRYQTLIPDIEQEVYAALWKRLGGGKEIDHPASYLYKMALTTALAVVRKHAPESLPIEDETEPALRNTPGPFGGLLPPERARLLGEMIERLSPEEGRAIRAHLAGFSHTEIAGLFGWTESVARHRIYRSIEALRETMKAQTAHDAAAARS